MASAPHHQSVHRVAAVRAAEASLTKHTTMRGNDALRIARTVVAEAAAHLEAETAEKLAGVKPAEVMVSGTVALFGIALHAVVVTDVIRRGGRAARVCAATNFAVNVGVAAYGQHRKYRARQAARTFRAEGAGA